MMMLGCRRSRAQRKGMLWTGACAAASAPRAAAGGGDPPLAPFLEQGPCLLCCEGLVECL